MKSREVTGQPHPLQGLWLVRKSLRGEDIDPFGTVMDLADETSAQKIFKALEKYGRKFGPDYLETRRAVEVWVQAEGRGQGLQPDVDHPLYFRVRQAPVTKSLPGQTVISIPCEAVQPNKTTFTFDDSFHNHAILRGRPYPHTPEGLQPQVLTASRVAHRLNTDGFPSELADDDPQRYIECQVWSRELPVFDKAREMLGVQACQDEVVVVDLASFSASPQCN